MATNRFLFAPFVAATLIFLPPAEREGMARAADTPSADAEAGARDTVAATWPRFRGPNGGGSAATARLPDGWIDADYRWRRELPGEGSSSPVVWGDRVYVTAADAAARQRTICCLSASDGQPLWQRTYAFEPFRQHADTGFAPSTPAVDGERVYVAWTSPEAYRIVALDAANGREVWQRDLGPVVSQHGFGASPLVCGDLLIVPNDQEGPSALLALDAAKGEPRWQAPRKSGTTAYATPCLYQPPTGTAQLITASEAEGVVAYDLAEGRRLWELPVLENRPIGSPIVLGARVLVTAGAGGGGKQCLAIEPPDAANARPPRVAFEVGGAVPYVPTPVAHGDLVFLLCDTGRIACVRASSGEVVWRDRLEGRYYASPICVGERICCISREGEVTLLAAGERFEPLGHATLGAACDATPAVAGGTIYFRTAKELLALGPRP